VSECTKAFIFSGPPGAGKGTLAQLCKQKLGWVQLSTGDLCRKHISEGTSFGKQLDFVIKSGKLVDDTVILEMVTEWIEQHIVMAKAIIFDGFPRTLVQAELFVELLEKRFPQLSMQIINFEISDEILVERLVARRTCQNKKCQAIYSVRKCSSRNPKIKEICDLCKSSLIQRVDDLPETVIKRLQVYHQHEKLLLNYCEKQGFKIEALNVKQSIEKIFDKFVELVGK